MKKRLMNALLTVGAAALVGSACIGDHVGRYVPIPDRLEADDPNEDVHTTVPPTWPEGLIAPVIIRADPNCNTCTPIVVERMPVPQATPETVAVGLPPVVTLGSDPNS